MLLLWIPTLPPSGAQILRDVRADLLAHPRGFSMTCWHTCIAARVAQPRGWLGRTRWRWWRHADEADVFRSAATRLQLSMTDARPLFLDYELSEARDASKTAARITAFLVQHGYAA